MKKMTQRIGQITTRTWLYLFVAMAIVCVLALRHNNQTMIRLRQSVYTADKSNGDVNSALNKLRAYVYTHMNTDLSSGGNNIKPPIQLKYTYERLYDAQLNQIQKANQGLYTDAENYCQAQDPAHFYGYYRLPCVQNYIVNHGLKSADINIPAGLYEFDFISPAWSPDLAGFSLIASLIFLSVFLGRLVLDRWHHRKNP